jgi:hypothetical protein
MGFQKNLFCNVGYATKAARLPQPPLWPPSPSWKIGGWMAPLLYLSTNEWINTNTRILQILHRWLFTFYYSL